MTPLIRIIGIDPGASGGIATLHLGDGQITGYQATKLPETERDIWDLLWRIVFWDAIDHAAPGGCVVLEKVGSMPGQGVSSTFKFGQSYGMCRAFGIALGVPLHELAPSVWQKALGLNGKFASKTERKNAHKARAQELFPQAKITHATADALLIAEAFRRLNF